MIRNVIWDFDGTLFDTAPAVSAAFQKVLDDNYSISYESAAILKLISIDPKHCANEIASKHVLDGDRLLREVKALYKTTSLSVQRPFNGVAEILKIMQSRGSNFIVTHRDRHSTIALLERFNLLKYFTFIIAREDLREQKPSPVAFIGVLTGFNLDKYETVGIGDRDIDVRAANRAGILSIFFNPAGHSHNDAALTIASYDQFEELIMFTDRSKSAA
jgi:HAD superfamily hydrolase (TIGR01549 family)